MNEANARISASDDVRKICRSCLCSGDKLIPLYVPYNSVINAKYEYVDARETIAKLMMACGNVQIEPDDGLPQGVCIKCFINIRATFVYGQMCKRSDAELREIFQQHSSADFWKSEVELVDPLDDQVWEEPEIVTTESEIVTAEPDVKIDEPISTNNSESISPLIFDDDFERDESTDSESKDDFFGTPEKCANKRSKKKTKDAEDETDGPSEDVTAQKRFICEICGKVFNQRSYVRQHKRIVHTGKNFVCDICKRAYKTKARLKGHMRSHEDRADVSHLTCTICGKKNATETSLAYHMKFHSADRLFKCDQCGKAYKKKLDLNNHSKCHLSVKPYACSVCDKSFALKANWKYHMMNHSGERPHRCTVCGASFARNFVLNIHMRMHTGDRPHQCECGERFLYSHQLLKHRNDVGHFEIANEILGVGRARVKEK